MSKYRKTEYKSRCPRCAENGRDTSGNNLHNYGEGNGSYCFSCGHTILSDEERDKRGLNNFDEFYEESMGKELITQEELDEVKETTGTKGHGLRGITDATLKTYAVRHAYSAEDGKPIERYYPCFINGELSGFKVRILPKDFTTIGKVGKDCELFGYFKFKQSRGKYVVLALGGEEDAMATYQMLADYNKSKGSDFENIPVVSGVVGENGADKQVQSYYEWFNKFEKIVVIRDMDEAGEKALHKVVKVLPKGKVFVTELPLKDPSDMLQQGKEKQFLDCFFKAKPYNPAGLVGSSQLLDKVIEQVSRPKIPLPPFLNTLEKMLGQFSIQTIGVIAAGTGAAKTTLANEIIYYLLFNSPYKTGIVSLELDAGQYGQALLSRHINNKISSIEGVDNRLAYLNTEDIRKKSDELFKLENGSDRFVLLDERDFSIEVMKEKILEMIITTECQVIILDPVSDLFEDLPFEAQAAFMKFLKGVIKQYPVSFLLLAHIRKSSDNKSAASTGAFVPEEAIFGSGSLTKSASWVVMLSRDKYNEDEVIRNTTHVILSKNRSGSVTGKAGEIYYDQQSHQMYDKDDYFNSRGGEFYGNS